MFIVISTFPPIQQGKDTEFQEWFASSGEAFSKFTGFINRRLLKPVNGGNYAAIVEFTDQASFQAMHGSPVHEAAAGQVKPLFDGTPTPTFYQVVNG